MHSYRINIDKKVLRLLGAQLYGDTPSIISELVQNAYDADAKAVWITINTVSEMSIVVQDDGIGMTPDEVNSRFLNIGQDRRSMYPESPGGRKVLGRKGIGKLAVFSLAKVVDVYSKTVNDVAACRLDFDAITLKNEEPISLDENSVVFVSFSDLKKDEKEKYFVDGVVLFPEVIGGNYSNFAPWMTYKCLVSDDEVTD